MVFQEKCVNLGIRKHRKITLDKKQNLCMSMAEKHTPKMTALQKGKDMLFFAAVTWFL